MAAALHQKGGATLRGHSSVSYQSASQMERRLRTIHYAPVLTSNDGEETLLEMTRTNGATIARLSGDGCH